MYTPSVRFKTLSLQIVIIGLYCSLGNISLFAQQKYNGRVLNDQNLPLAGASIILQVSQQTLISDQEGTFSLSAASGEEMLISYVGYVPQKIILGNTIDLTIVLRSTPVDLEEVLVVGYTTQKVKELSSSIAIVKPRDLTSLPLGQVEQMLQGRVAGLTVITSGMPGGSSNVRLHGIGNFGDVTPLYIIDGVPGDINNLNPQDIESLQVLKDASAYSIYGVRGANGVIVVTTRNGKAGKTHLSYDSYLSLTQPLSKGLDLLNPQETADLTWLALKNSHQVDANGNPNSNFYGNGANPVLPDFFLAGPNLEGFPANAPQVNPNLHNLDFSKGPIYQIIPTNKRGIDWFHELFKPALSQQHTLSVSGAKENNRYFLSLGYLDQQGTLLYTYLKRYTTRVNTTFALGKHFRLGENLQLAFRTNPKVAIQQASNLNEVVQALLTQPILPVYDIKGGWAHFNPFDFEDNPIAKREIAKDNVNNSWEFLGNLFAEWDICKGLTWRSSFGGNLNNYYRTTFSQISYLPLSNEVPNNTLQEGSGYRRSLIWTNTLSYSTTFNAQHALKILIGTEAIDNYNRDLSAQKQGFFTSDLNYRFLNNGSPAGQSNASFASASTLFSLISRVDYGLKDKYLLGFTLRRDGSSIFGPKKRYGWFPAASVAWRLSEEPFLQNLPWLTELKLRASWGKTGFYGNTNPFNQFTLYGGSIADAYYDIYGTNAPIQGFRVLGTGEPLTSWQEDIATTLGLEAILWNGRLNVTADWYHKKTKGLLFPLNLPDILGGATAPNTNIGSVKNTGLDLLISSQGKFSNKLGWNAALTFTTYRNVILQINELPYFIPPVAQGGLFVRNEVGLPMGSFFGYKIIGLFQSAEDVSNSPQQNAAAPGRFKYQDSNGDGQINEADRVFLGNPNPKFTTGIQLGFTYHYFDFTAFFYASIGNKVKNVPRLLTDFYPNIAGASPIPQAKSKAALYHSWTPQRTQTDVPIAENSINFSNFGEVNSYGIEDGSFFRCRSLSLGYNFAPTWLKKYQLSKFRMYAQVMNLFTVTRYTGLDPELLGNSSAFGIDFGNYPNNQRQYVFGIMLGF